MQLRNTYVDIQDRGRTETIPIVKVKATACCTPLAQGDEDAPWSLPRSSGRHCRLLHREDTSTPNENGNVAKRGIYRHVLASAGIDSTLGVPIVVDLALARSREDAVHRSHALRKHGSDEDSGAKEELHVSPGKRRIVWKFPAQGPHYGRPCGVRLVEECVHVWQQLKPYAHSRLGGFNYRRPDVRLLWNSRKYVVVSIEREECRKLHPSVAELLVRVAIEAASIDTKHWDTEQRERQGLGDTKVHVLEQSGVVSSPMTGPLTRSDESRPANDERSLAREDVEQGIVCCVEDLVTEKVVDIVFLDTVVVSGIRRDGVHRQVALHVVDNIRGMVHIPNARGRRSPQVVGSCSCGWNRGRCCGVGRSL